MQHIATLTAPSGGAHFEFLSIPDTFTDLVVKFSGRGATPFLGMRLNDSTANLSRRSLSGTGSAVSSGTRTDTYMGDGITSSGNSFTANTFSNVEIYIPNYRAATAKSISIDMVTENNATLSWQSISAVLWNDTSAITSLQLYEWGSGNSKINFAEHSSASLYGITAGSDGIVAVS